MLKRKMLLEYIGIHLAHVKATVATLNAVHFYDINVVAEDFFAHLLNAVYGYSLVNLNHDDLNKAAIDLGDSSARIAVQVTSQRNKAKVQKTLDKFSEHGLADDYDTLKVFIIGDRTGDYPTLQVPTGVSFSGSGDVIDIDGLMKDISGLDTEELTHIATVIRREVSNAAAAHTEIGSKLDEIAATQREMLKQQEKESQSSGEINAAVGELRRFIGSFSETILPDPRSSPSQRLLETEVMSLREERYNETQYRFRSVKPTVSFGTILSEDHPDGGMTTFRVEIRNDSAERTVDDVSLRVTSLARLDTPDSPEIISGAFPLLAISGTGPLPFSPMATTGHVSPSDHLIFDLLNVRWDRRGGSELSCGECIKAYRGNYQGAEFWRILHPYAMKAGKYRITLQLRARDTVPVTKQFVFWGDRHGARCVPTDDNSALSNQPLDFAPIDLDTMPPEMHPHQLRAVKEVLQRSDYDGMTPDEAYLSIDSDVPNMHGLANVVFLTPSKRAVVSVKPHHWVVAITEDEAAAFPTGIPGFPNAIRRADFDIAWNAVRGLDNNVQQTQQP
jgi:hypothetical protein